MLLVHLLAGFGPSNAQGGQGSPVLGAAACTDTQVLGNEVQATLHPSTLHVFSLGVPSGHPARVLPSPA